MQSLNDLLSRIQTDYAFYVLFKTRPLEALAPYELTAKERATLTESGPQVSAFLGPKMPTLTGTKNFVSLGSTDLEFDPAAALKRPDVQRTVAQICDASTPTDKSAAVLVLMEQIG
jgi:hypothetical protein